MLYSNSFFGKFNKMVISTQGKKNSKSTKNNLKLKKQQINSNKLKINQFLNIK